MRRRLALVGISIGSLLAGCGLLFDFGDYDTSRSPRVVPEPGIGTEFPDAAKRVQIAALSPFAIRRTYPRSLVVSINRNGVEGAIDLTVTGLPTGVSVAPATIADGATTAVLTFTSTESAALATTNVTVQASLTGAPEDAEPLALTVGQSRLDPTFGDGGILVGNPDEDLQDFTMQDAVNALVAVRAPPAGLTRDRFVIYHVSPDGALDPVLTIPQAHAGGYRIAVAPNGDYIIFNSQGQAVESYPSAGGAASATATTPTIGSVHPGGVGVTTSGTLVVLADGTLGSQTAVVLSFLAANGDPDLRFGGDGGVYFPGDRVGDLLVTNAGLVTCLQQPGSVDPDAGAVLLVRLLVDGGADPSFAGGGAPVARAGYSLGCAAIAAAGSGYAVVGDATDPASKTQGFLMQLDANGRLGDGGFAMHAVGESSLRGVSADSVGTIYSAGSVGDGASPTAIVFADLPDAAGPNAVFGVGDGGSFPLPIGSTSQATAVRALADQRLLVAGTTETDGGTTWFLARILP